MRKGEEWKQYNQAVNWIFGSFFIAAVLTYIAVWISLPVAELIQKGISANHLKAAGEFMGKSLIDPMMFFDKITSLFKFAFMKGGNIAPAYYLPICSFLIFPVTLIVGLVINPYEMVTNAHGSGRIATDADVKKMKLFNGFIVVLGRYKGKLLKLPETLSVLVVAPPGTGKTVGVVIPTILESDGITIIVNDPKPELCYKTSGYRSLHGPVFVVNWGASDDPSQGVFYPNWNPLSDICLPPAGPPRDMYVDQMCNVLIEEPKGSADPHWTKTGRNAMNGFVHFIVSKMERAKADDYFYNKISEGTMDNLDKQTLETYYKEMAGPEASAALENLRNGDLNTDNYVHVGTWENLPEYWHGEEPCLAVILDWMTETQIKISADLKRRMDEGDQSAAFADPMKDMLDGAISEAKLYGYSHRAILELNQLASTPDKERGSILSVALTGIGIFKNSAVRERTKSSDFSFKDTRGMKDPITGEFKPISIYLSINLVDAAALSVITGIFVELLSRFLISNPPNITTRQGIKIGPFPVLFVLDEFPQMPKLSAVKDGPAVGRGQKISYLLIGQDLGQISGQYGKDDLETIITTTSAKVILSQNNEQTAQRFEKMIGNRTIMTESYSKTEGMAAKFSAQFQRNVSTSFSAKAVITAARMLSMPSTEQIVLFQGFLKYPIVCQAPRWFLDKEMTRKVNLKASPFVPYWIVAQRKDADFNILSNFVDIIEEQENKKTGESNKK